MVKQLHTCHVTHIKTSFFLLKYNGLAIVQKTTKNKTDWGWSPWSSGYTLLLLTFYVFYVFFKIQKVVTLYVFLPCFVRFLELQCNVCLNVMLNWKLRCIDLLCTLLCVLCIPLPVFLSLCLLFSFLLLFLVCLLFWVLPVLIVCFFMCFASYQQTLTSFLWVTTDQLWWACGFPGSP